jgi:hypothetical protein
MIEVGELYLGFPIYFSNSIDFRGRLYPWTYLFSRTTGKYKYLLCDFEETEVSDAGFYNLLKGYYQGYNNSGFLKYSLSREELYSHFKKTKRDFSKNKNIIYFTLLEQTIEKTFDRKAKTGFTLEIDQKSSVAVFFALMFKNKELGNHSNIFGKNDFDVISLMQSKTQTWFDKEEKDFPRLIEKFKKDRTLHKKAFMCFGYSQGERARFIT